MICKTLKYETQKKWIVLLVAITLISCHSSNLFHTEDKVIERFPQTYTQEGKEIKLDVLGCMNLFVVDTFLLAYCPMYTDYYFHVFNTSTLEHLGSFFPVGRGPNEFYAIIYAKCNETIHGVSKAWIANYNTNYQWNITESVKQKRTIIDSTINNKNEESEVYWIMGKNHILYGIGKTDGNFEYIRYDLKGQKELNRNKLYSRNMPYDYLDVVGINLNVKPDNRQVALIGWSTNHIGIFNSDFTDLKSMTIYGPLISIDKAAAQEWDERTLFYSDAYVSDRFIYGLYINQPAKDRRHHSGNEEIHVFDWDGNPILNVIIPENIMFFTVDEKNKCLYGLTSDEKVYKYDLSGYLTIL